MKMTQEELKKKLDAHRLWLETRRSGKVKGERLNLARANLARADLARANLAHANLTRADLTDANLYGADLAHANLAHANLTRADLARADLARANLHGADLTDANLHGADLTDANLYDADLTCADLTNADLHGADLTDANLTGASLDYSAWPLWCGSLYVKIDKRLAAQLMYHAMRAMQSCKDDESVAAVLASPECVALANHSNRAQECGPIEVFSND